MGKIYKGQDYRFTLTGGIDITGGSAKIQYKKPGSDVVNEKIATISNPLVAECYYDFVPADNDTSGPLIFWLKLTMADNKIYFGEPFRLGIYEPGS